MVSSVTNQAGSYDIPYLLPGAYQVSVQAPGFKKAVRDGLELQLANNVVRFSSRFNGVRERRNQ